MNTISAKELKALLSLPGKPCVSVYLPTQPGGAEKDPIQFKNLVAEAEERLLGKGMDEDAIKKMLRPAKRLLTDIDFWKNTAAGLALFLTPTEMRWYRVKPFGPRVFVGERFFVKPLLSMLDHANRFFVLGLNQKRIHLWEGDADGMREVDLKATPTSLSEALRFHDRDEPLMFHGPRTSVGSWGTVFSGQGVGIDTFKDDLLLYFQKIDRGLHDYLPDKAPLILAGVDYLWPIYRKANRHPHLLERGIPGNSERWSMRDLHDKAWDIVRARFEQPLQRPWRARAERVTSRRRQSGPPAKGVWRR